MDNTTTFVRVADGIYKLNGHFYHRPKKPDGKRTYRSLNAATLKAAKAEYARRSGRGVDDTKLTCGEALQHYLAADCPNKRRQQREGAQHTQEVSRATNLLRYWMDFPCSRMSNAALDDFADWRLKHSRKGSHGGRACDLEIITLKNAIRWCVRRGLLHEDPFATIKVSPYRNANVRHCREVAPRSGDELHDLAAHLFESPRSQVFGWLMLITAMVGGRISEMVALRADAAPGEPGSVVDDILYLRRKKKGANNFFRIHADLAVTLENFWRWRNWFLKRRKSPWWFPGHDISKPLEHCSLNHALARATPLMGVGTRTAHGLRSFYVTARRSGGVSDAQIALEVGQISGGKEIVRTYGEATPHKVQWMPTRGRPAWTVLPCCRAKRKGAKVIPYPAGLVSAG